MLWRCSFTPLAPVCAKGHGKASGFVRHGVDPRPRPPVSKISGGRFPISSEPLPDIEPYLLRGQRRRHSRSLTVSQRRRFSLNRYNNDDDSRLPRHHHPITESRCRASATAIALPCHHDVQRTGLAISPMAKELGRSRGGTFKESFKSNRHEQVWRHCAIFASDGSKKVLSFCPTRS
jgi:hypothetical protein